MMIDITGVDLVEFVKRVYDLSRPQGMGLMHYQEGGLTDAEARSIVDHEDPFQGQDEVVLYMDYVRGRACKMGVYREDGRLQIDYPWYDHSDTDLLALLMHLGMGNKMPGDVKHVVSCNCQDCCTLRGE